MLIVQVEPPADTGQGDYYYRTHAPGAAMAQEEGAMVVNLTNIHRKKEEIMRDADVLVLVNICDPDLLPLIAERKAKGMPTVYELADDISAVQPWSPVYFFFRNNENLALAYRMAATCDALQVTVPELKKLYGSLNKICEVFPNQISHIPPARQACSRSEIVVGWGGSHGHLEDLSEIAPDLISWVVAQQNVVLHLMCSEPIWARFESLPANKKRRSSPGSIGDYYRFLTQIDIGIAPLKDTAFNRSRSDVKFLEYAVSGVAPVMQHLEPYINSVDAGKTGFLFKDTRELMDILSRLAADGPLLRAVAQQAREYVLLQRLERAHGKERLCFYRKLLGSNNGADSNREKFKNWSELEDSKVRGRHLTLNSGGFENLIHNGLVLMQLRDDREKASLLFEEAVRLAPDNYLPCLFGASVSQDPVVSLRKAIQLKPNSLSGWVLLGEELARRGDILEAFKSFEQAVQLYPDYESPYLRAASLLKAMGQDNEAEKLLGKIRWVVPDGDWQR